MKKIVIIGGGISGLSAGIYAQKNGFVSVVLEKNQVPGGECTGWDRNGFHIDGCIHWLAGTKEGSAFNRLWKETGALDGVPVHHPDSFLVFEHKEGNVTFHRDLERIRESLLELSPGDSQAIESFYNTIKILQEFRENIDKPIDLMSITEKIKMFWSMRKAGPLLGKYCKISLKSYAERFSHPALRETLAGFLPEGYSAIAFFFAIASFTKGDASVPSGGSKAMALRMAEKYKSLGGVIETGCEAQKIEITGSRAECVRCSDGRTFSGDFIIAACDARLFFDQFLEGKYPDPSFEKRFKDTESYPLASEILLAFSCEETMEGIPRAVNFPVKPFRAGSRTVDRLLVRHFDHEPGFSPEGYTVLTCDINQFEADYNFWEQLKNNREAYRKEKERIGLDTLKALEERFPEKKGKIKLIDIATPLTYEKWCNAYRGAFMPFMLTTKGKMLAHSGRIKGIKNMFLSGQWIEPPGGLPAAVKTGRDTIMRICRDEQIPFKR